MAQTLAELKAENAKAEEEAASQPQAEAEETEVIEDELEQDKSEEVAEPVDDESSDDESEDQAKADIALEEWMQSDEPESQAEKKFTDSDIGAAKAKLRAKLESKHNGELDKLKEKIAKLESGQTQAPVQPTIKAKPKRSDYDNADDPDEAFFEALTDWKVEQVEAKREAQQATENTQAQQQAQLKQVEAAVDQHYERALKLSQKSNISPEAYQATQLKVRQEIESIFPKAGDHTTDVLIANLGEGSEKVFYNLGVNQARLDTLKQKLTTDKSGLSAAVYLGKLAAELNAPQKKRTNAPKPAARLSGDAVNAGKFGVVKKKYDKAIAAGDTNKAFKLRSEARKGGADTANW